MADEKSSQKMTATQGSVYLITSDGKLLNLPIPSRSPKDPLNWSLLRRTLALTSMSLFTIVGLVQVQGTAMLLGLASLEQEYAPEELSPFRMDTLSTAPTIFWGVGALIWVPISMAIGRRPVFLFCTILLPLATLIAATSRSFYMHLLARCLQGLAGAISFSTIVLSIIDMTYIHQRPQYLAMYVGIVSSMANFGLTLTPYMVAIGGSWRSFYWLWLPACLFTSFLAFIWAPETLFYRPAMAFDGHILSQEEDGKVTVYSNWAEVPGGKPVPTAPSSFRFRNIISQAIFWNRTRTGGWAAIRNFRRQILICAINPLILWVLVLNALVTGGMVITCSTYAQVLLAPPYNFSFKAIGLAKFTNGIGALLALPASGLLTTYMVRMLARRNRGVREAEHYLPSFIIPIMASVISLALFGAAVQRKWAWQWILLFVGIDFFAAIALLTSNTLWVTEAFPHWAGPALVILGCGGYAVSFGLSVGVESWILSQGLGGMYMELAAMTFIVGIIGLPISYWGKRLREWMHTKYVDEEENWG